MSEVNSRSSPALAFPCGHNNPDDNLFCDVCGVSRPASENVERNAPAPLRQRSQEQSEQREPILQDDDESLLDPRLQRFLSERRRVARVRWWGTLAAVTLTILVVAAVLFGAGLGRGRNSLSSAPRLNQPLTPANSEAPAPAIAFQPPAVAESPPAIEQVPAPLPPQPPPPTHVEPTPSRAMAGSTLHGKTDRGATPSRRSGAAADSVQVMAGSLIGQLGRERAEEKARANACWYAPGSKPFLYWQRVANAVRSGVAGPSATAPTAYKPGPSYWDPVRGAHIDSLSGQPLVGR